MLGLMESASSRSLQLLTLLQTGREWTAAELARRLEVSERTVRRDAGRLRDLGYDVTSRPGPGATYRLRPSMKIPPLLLTPDEVATIITGLLVLEARAPDDASVAAARAKIEQVLPAGLRRRAAATALATQILTDAPSPVDWRLVGTVADAVATGAHLCFDYTDRQGLESQRTVDPYRHILRRRHWYLIGYDLGRADWRLFRLDRVQAPRTLPGPHHRHEFPYDSIDDWLVSDFGAHPRASIDVPDQYS
ncbi:helix-turn-helix transcriptional regulator [Rhodococcus indonesiensis]